MADVLIKGNEVKDRSKMGHVLKVRELLGIKTKTFES